MVAVAMPLRPPEEAPISVSVRSAFRRAGAFLFDLVCGAAVLVALTFWGGYAIALLANQPAGEPFSWAHFATGRELPLA